MTGIWYVVGFAFAGVSFVFLTIGAAWLISHRNRGDEHKGLPYESGIDTYGDTHGRFGLSFYIYALLFVAFDIEVVFIYLWAIAFRTSSLGGLVEHADLRRDPAARARLRLAEGGADMALTPEHRGPAGRRPRRPAADLPAPSPARASVTSSPRSSSRTRSGRRPIREAYDGGRQSDITHLREFEASGLGRRDDARWSGVLEVIPTKADYVLDLIRMNSLWPLLSGLACCAIEMMSAATSKNDMDRWGMFPFRASPRQADVLIVAGTLTTKMAGPLVRLWEQMPEPKWCVAMGDCTCSGGRYKRSYSTVEGIDRVMPVDVYVPGCPPRPEGLIYGMMKLQQLVKDRRGHWPERADRPDRAARTSRAWIAAFKARLEARFADQLTGPVRQRHDETEIRIAAGDVVPGPDRAARRAGRSTSSS